jgi:hypothetical protein
MMREFLTRELFMPEIWNAFAYAAALLLATASLADGLRLFQVRGRWGTLAAGARVGALVALTMVLIWVAIVGGNSLPSAFVIQPASLQQVAFALALATLLVYLVLAWRLRVDAALMLDLVALALVLVGIVTIGAGGPPLSCDQGKAPSQLQWALFLAGTGGLVVAGSTGLTLALRTGLSRRTRSLKWSPWIDLHALLKCATAVALVALGGGLALSLWGSWQTAGVLASDNAREGWIAAAWLVAAMSMLVRRAGRRWGRWTAGLAFLAATILILGLIAGADLHLFLET